MELHLQSSAKAKQLWELLRAAFFIMRNGIISKRKFLGMDMNLMMKRGKLLIGKNLESLKGKQQQQQRHSPALTISDHNSSEEYEFSCENSPNPAFFHINSKRVRSYFPCMGAPSAAEAEEAEEGLERGFVIKRMIFGSPYSVRVSNYSKEDGDEAGVSKEVDSQAEEFIKRFYEQLQAQSQDSPLMHIQEDEHC